MFGKFMVTKSRFFVWGIAFFVCAGCAVNPLTGESQLMLIPPEQDIAIGQQYAPEVEKQMGGRIPNDDLQRYVDNVGRKVSYFSQRADWDYHFVALQDKSVNAFALPGGYIFITKGMLKSLTTEAQLAAILGHETAHVVARHSSAAMSNQIGADIVLSAVLSEKTPPGVRTAADIGRQIVTLNYSRKDEKEADLAGLDYTVKAGYNPYGMVETMQILEEQEKTRPIEFLASHPSPENRITYLKDKIETKHYDLAGLRIGKEEYSANVLSRLNN